MSRPWPRAHSILVYLWSRPVPISKNCLGELLRRRCVPNGWRLCRAWCFLVDVIIFLAPLDVFDQSLAEDKSVNRVEDSTRLWRSICASRVLARAHGYLHLTCPLLTFVEVGLILILNKCDLLAKKLEAGISLAKFVPSFEDRPNNVENVTKCAYNVHWLTTEH
jgi:hypothetical protein